MRAPPPRQRPAGARHAAACACSPASAPRLCVCRAELRANTAAARHSQPNAAPPVGQPMAPMAQTQPYVWHSAPAAPAPPSAVSRAADRAASAVGTAVAAVGRKTNKLLGEFDQRRAQADARKAATHTLTRAHRALVSSRGCCHVHTGHLTAAGDLRSTVDAMKGKAVCAADTVASGGPSGRWKKCFAGSLPGDKLIDQLRTRPRSPRACLLVAGAASPCAARIADTRWRPHPQLRLPLRDRHWTRCTARRRGALPVARGALLCERCPAATKRRLAAHEVTFVGRSSGVTRCSGDERNAERGRRPLCARDHAQRARRLPLQRLPRARGCASGNGQGD